MLALAVALPATARAADQAQQPQHQRDAGQAQQQKDADDTGRNVRDRQDGAVTPMQQSNAKADLDITQHIRRTVVNDDKLSTNAHNVKIVTQDGVVTLRGPVKTAQEKQAVVAAAQSAPGVKRVDDQLEIERKQ
jgi:osmotically-inducible protein OsmY